MEELLSSLGFKEITKDSPIHFIEKLPVTFGNLYDIDRRFERIYDDMRTEIMFGIGDKRASQIDIIGNSYYKGMWSRFCIQTHKNYYKDKLIFYISANEKKLREMYQKYLSHITMSVTL